MTHHSAMPQIPSRAGVSPSASVAGAQDDVCGVSMTPAAGERGAANGAPTPRKRAALTIRLRVLPT
ncbi:MAG: hypothetical protein IH822_02560 [Chloroflexi bacterium]|nr:hypothetical protein [Chloroflexota bacterium]